MAPKKHTLLGRPATGLPRYFLDCGWWRHPKFAGLDPAALFVWQAAVSYCTEHATDGVLPADVEDLAAALGVRSGTVSAALPELAARRLLTTRNGALHIPGWAEHNPTRAEVKAYTDERSRSGLKGNHKRHHVDKGVVAANCPLCTASDDLSDTVSDPICDDSDPNSDPEKSPHGNGEQQVTNHIGRCSDPSAIADGSHGMGWDGMGTEGDRSTSVVSPPVPPTDDDRTFVLDIARARGARLDPSRVYGWNWIRRTADSLEPHRTRIVAMRAEGLTPAAIDLALDGHQTDPAPAPTPGPAAPAPWTPTVVPDALDHDAHAAAVRSVRSALA